MSIAQTWQTESTSLSDTLRIAASIGRKLRGGEIMELASDLGGGKTAFVCGLAQGMGSRDMVHSPSFTLSNQYQAGDLTLYHFDFYRLAEPGIMRNELAEIIEHPKTVVAVEWAEIVNDVLPAKHLSVTIKAISETSRHLTFRYPKEYSHLFKINT